MKPQPEHIVQLNKSSSAEEFCPCCGQRKGTEDRLAKLERKVEVAFRSAEHHRRMNQMFGGR